MNLNTVRSRLIQIVVAILGMLIINILSACVPGPTPTPTPTGTPIGTPHPQPTPTPIQPPPGQYQSPDFGIVWSSSYFNKEYTHNPPQQWSADAGAYWDRWDLHWEHIVTPREGLNPPVWTDTTSSNYFPSPKENYYYSYDVAADGALGTNPQLHVLAVFNGGFPTATILGSDPYGQDGTWKDFVADVVENYRNRGVGAWEVGNEGGFITTDNANFSYENYLDALKRVCEQIKGVPAGQPLDKDKPVILGSPFRTESDEVALHGPTAQGAGAVKYYNILDHLRTPTYAAITNNCLEAAGIHAYFTNDEAASSIISLTNQGLWTKPFWVTEAGAGAQRSSNPEAPCYSREPCVTEEQQADYMVQFFALTKQAFKRSSMADNAGTIMYHRLRDDADPKNPESTYGLLNSNNEPWAAYYAAWMTSQLLGESNYLGDPDGDKSGEGYKHLIFKGRNDKFIHVLWATNENTPSPVTVTRMDPLATYMLMYRRKLAQDYFQGKDKPLSLNLVSGTATVSLTHATKVNDIFPIGGETVILIEYRTTVDKSSPTVGAALLYDDTCSAATRTAILGFDAGLGMKDLIVVASPPTWYDLSWTEPGKLYSTILPVAPAVGATWYYTVTDKAGNMTTGSITNDGAPNCGGGDHPDDNYSSASLPSLPVGSLLVLTGTQQLPRIAILNHGFAGNTFEMLMQLGEPAMLIDTNFDPVATYNQFKTLVIPSGGLFGLSDSASFRARLEEYTRLGGTIVAFAQQHGEEFQALPGTGVGGYGWTEDNSCFDASLYISQWHPIVSGFDRATLNAHVDGYFTQWRLRGFVAPPRDLGNSPAYMNMKFCPNGSLSHQVNSGASRLVQL